MTRTSSRSARRPCLAALCTLALGSAAQAAPPSGTPLRDLAAARGLYIGYALSPNLSSTGSYGTLAGSQFDCVTAENAMKWDATEPSQGSFSWSGADQVVSFAGQHNQRIRGHTLVWHSQLPGWVSSLPTGSVKAAMVNHVTTVAKHYAGRIYAWDVVNEVLNEDGTLRSSPFANAMGREFVAEAFRAARAADPAAKLYINDYNIEAQNAKSNGLYDLVKWLLSQGAPIDGVGFQAHFSTGSLPSSFQANMQRFSALGLDVAITELDIAMPTPASSANLQTQAANYTTVVNACLATSRCVGITVWGVDDAHSWIPQFSPGRGAPLLFDEGYNAKPAYTAVQNALSSGAPTDTTPPTAPANLTSTGKTATTIALTWTASTDNVRVTGYEVYSGATRLTSVDAGTGTTLTGLPAAATYSLTVRARDAAGNVSNPSNAVTVTTDALADTTPPSTPGTPVASNVSATSLTLGWGASTDDVGVTGYDVYGGATRLASTGANPGTTLTGLSPATAHVLTVRARDAAGNVSSPSYAANVTTSALADTTPPTAPASLTSTGKTASSISLAWTASTDDVGVTGYDVYGGATRLTSIDAGTGTTLTGLPAAATYSLTVRARDAAGNLSNPSNAVTVTTDALADTTPPTAPGTPAASEVTASSLTLAWSASSDDVGVIGYDVLQKSGAGDVQVASTAGTSASLTGLSPSTSYTCFVRARDASGNTSPASGTVSVATRAARSGGGSLGCGGARTGPSTALSFMSLSGLALAFRPRGRRRRDD